MAGRALRDDARVPAIHRAFPSALVLGLCLCAAAPAHAASPPQQEPPLRFSEPVDAIVADLERFIPQYMREENIPGLAIALVHDGRVAWTEGFAALG